jgi:hypothetical protein
MARLLQLRGIEDPEVPADDLRAGVALAALRTGVPADHAAVGVEHEDRVVAHRLDQEPEALLALAQRFLGQLGLGDVPGHLREPDVLAGVVEDRGDQDICPELAAVLADPPALLGVLPLAERALELVLGVARLLLLRRVEDPEVLADDLRRAIALGALRAGVPARDDARGRQHEDRIVLDRVDQQPEPFLAAAQLVLGGPLGRDVLHLQEDVQRLASRVADRGERRKQASWLG